MKRKNYIALVLSLVTACACLFTACKETEELMPLPISLAHKMAKKLTDIRKSGELDYLNPDGKTQVTVEYEDDKPVRVDTIVVSTQHLDTADLDVLKKDITLIPCGGGDKVISEREQWNDGSNTLCIAPGVVISMKALVNNAALLPNVELVSPKKVIGTSTINCIQSGVIFGAASQVDGMIERIKKEVNNPDLKVIATGGLASLIIPLTNHQIEIDDLLIFKGLLEIYRRNM